MSDFLPTKEEMSNEGLANLLMIASGNLIEGHMSENQRHRVSKWMRWAATRLIQK